MEDLTSAVFFDKRILSFIESIVYGYHRQHSVISGTEGKILARKADILALNEDLDRDLVETIRKAQAVSSVGDVLFFLLRAREMNILSDAREGIDVAIQDGRVLSKGDLKTLLVESADMPISWAVASMGEENKTRLTGKTKLSGGIDMNKLRNLRDI